MDIWSFLADAGNQKALAFYGGGFCVVVSAIWTAFLTLRKPPAKAESKPAATRSISVHSGLGAGGNLSVGGDVTVGRLPKAVYILAALGLVALVFSFVFAGGRTCVGTGVAVGGDITGGTVTVVNGGGPAAAKC